MADLLIRPARIEDLPRLIEIYNYYVLNTAVTFDLEPYTVEKRMPWFQQFGAKGRCRLLVAEEGETVLGYVGTTHFRPKAAYDSTVETTIYCADGAGRKGLGTQMYRALFEAIAGEDVHHIVAGYTLPNEGSQRLHQRLGFKMVGIFHEVGRKFGRYWDVAWTERHLTL